MLNEIIIIGALIGPLTVTSYRSIPEATDDTPFNTSTGERVYSGGVAVSRDLLCGACRKLHHRCAHPEDGRHIHYGDYLYLPNRGFYKVFDVMGATKYDRVTKKRYAIKQSVDLWVPTYKAECVIGLHVQPVYKVKVQ